VSADEPRAEPLAGDPGILGARRLEGKVAIVTGAGSRTAGPDGPVVGNGRASAIMLAREGARVALLDQQREWVEETHRIIKGEGNEAIVVDVDVADAESCRRAVQVTLDAYGTVSILVNNVGVTGPPGNAIEVDPDAFDRAMRINVTSMVLMAKYALPSMIEAGGGSIVNLSSVSGMLGGHPSLLYPISKTAVIGLTRAMAAHHARQGVRVNAIAPGTVYTPMVASRGMTPELRRARWEGTLLKVEGTAWDVAAAVVFLASDTARWITGIVLPVDAGATASRLEALSPRSDGGAPGRP
jgi:NAD(P)-dependent dehydrogenase (short-subunit alcohol dehydrogenase family)